MLIVAFNLGFLLFLGVKHNPSKINSLLTTLSANLSKYPDNLVVNLYKGRLVTNYNRPYLLWLDNQDNKDLLLVIDETATPKKITSYNASILLTSQNLVTLNSKTNAFSTLPLNYFSNQKITKEKVNQLVQIVDKTRGFLIFFYPVVFLLLAAVVPMTSLIVTLAYLFIASVIVFLVFKLFLRKHFHFNKIFQVSLHAITFPLLLDYSIMVIRPTIRMNGMNFLAPLRDIPFPMLFLIILAVFIAVGVHEAHAAEEYETKKLHHRRKK